MSPASVRTRSIWRWQLILAAATVSVTATMAVLDPARLTEPAFPGGSIAVVLLTAVTLLVPWQRVPPGGALLLPLAGIVAIGVPSFGGQTRASLLWVFPIAWIATNYRMPALGAAPGLIGVFLTVDAFVGDMQPALVQRAVIVLLCLGFMGVTISVRHPRCSSSWRTPESA